MLIFLIRKSHLMRVTMKGTLKFPLLFCTKFRPDCSVPVLFSRSCVSPYLQTKMMCVAARTILQPLQTNKAAHYHDYTKDRSLSTRIDPSVLCIYTDNRQRNGWDWFTDFRSLFLQFWMQLRADVEVILQYGIHPTQSFGKISPSVTTYPDICTAVFL
jgi:hypothetical protein